MKTISALLFLALAPSIWAREHVGQPLPEAAPVAETAPSAPPPLPVVAPRKVYADPWRLKSDTLSLKDAADELSRGRLADQERFYLLAAESLVAAEKPEMAVRLLENYRLQGGKDSRLLTTLAYYYELLGAPAEGVTVLENLLKFSPDDSQAALELARFYRLKGDAKAAEDMLEAKARSNPKDQFLQREVAAARREKKDYAGAEQALLRALETSREPETYKQLAMLYAADNKLDKAMAILDEASKALPDYYTELILLSGELCYQNGQREKAYSIISRLADRFSDPNGRLYFENRAKGIAAEIARASAPPAQPPAAAPVPDLKQPAAVPVQGAK